MREITLPVEEPKIKINGTIFDVLLADYEIYFQAKALFQRCEKYMTVGFSAIPEEEADADIHELVAFVDRALGEGAAKKISRGKPVGIKQATKWAMLIAVEASSHYAEMVANE